MVERAIALCEVQAYVYAAKLKLSEIARILGHSQLAKQKAMAVSDRLSQYAFTTLIAKFSVLS